MPNSAFKVIAIRAKPHKNVSKQTTLLAGVDVPPPIARPNSHDW